MKKIQLTVALTALLLSAACIKRVPIDSMLVSQRSLYMDSAPFAEDESRVVITTTMSDNTSQYVLRTHLHIFTTKAPAEWPSHVIDLTITPLSELPKKPEEGIKL